MTKFLGVDIAKIIHKNLSPKVNDLTIVVKGSPSRASGNLTGGTQASETTHTARGFSAKYKDSVIDGSRIRARDRDSVIDGSRIRARDREFIIFVESINPPVEITIGSTVTENEVVYELMKAEKDPAGATYTCQARR